MFFAFAQSTQSKRSYVFYTPLFLSLKKILRFRSTRVANRAVKSPLEELFVKTLSIILSFSPSETKVSAKVTVVRDKSFPRLEYARALDSTRDIAFIHT